MRKLLLLVLLAILLVACQFSVGSTLFYATCMQDTPTNYNMTDFCNAGVGVPRPMSEVTPLAR